MSKAIATLVTQPLIVAKVGLQSQPPPARQGKPFKSFIEVMNYIVDHEGPLALFKGITPQITKGVLVQGLLMMTKERCVLCKPKLGNMATHSFSTGWRFYSLSCSPIFAKLDRRSSRDLLKLPRHRPNRPLRRPNYRCRRLLSDQTPFLDELDCIVKISGAHDGLMMCVHMGCHFVCRRGGSGVKYNVPSLQSLAFEPRFRSIPAENPKQPRSLVSVPVVA